MFPFQKLVFLITKVIYPFQKLVFLIRAMPKLMVSKAAWKLCSQIHIRRHRLKRFKVLATNSRPTRKELEKLDEILQESGIRKFPVPFQNALTITSDVDNSNRERYEAYKKELVERAGLDFGDSVWLAGNYDKEERGNAFFTPWLTRREEIWPDHDSCSLFELIREHHLGNVDHWHSFYPFGIKFTSFEKFSQEEELEVKLQISKEAEEENSRFGTYGFHIQAASIFGDWGENSPSEIAIYDSNGACHRHLKLGRDPLDAKHNLEGRHVCFVTEQAVDSTSEIIALSKANSIRIRFRKTIDANCLKAVVLYSTHTDLLNDRIQSLRTEFGFSTNLSTRHGFYHTVPETDGPGGIGQCKLMAQKRHEFEEKLSTFYASFQSPNFAGAVFSDEPGSFAQTFSPESLAQDFVFSRTNAIDYPDSEDPNAPIPPSVERVAEGEHPSACGVLYPVRTRFGGYLHHLRSTNSRPSDRKKNELLGKEFAGKTVARNFCNRLQSVLDDLDGVKGKSAQFYTHLGNLVPWTDGLPKPYFEEKQITELRDRVFGAPVATGSRVWKTRPTVFCDYHLVLQQIAVSMKRRGENEIAVLPWKDPFTGRILGKMPAELYGQTFYVDEAERADVKLNGAVIEEVIRNRADETGRESLTVASSLIRHTVFRGCDPKRLWGENLISGSDSCAEWIQSKDSNSVLKITHEQKSDSQFSGFVVRPNLDPYGTQHLVCKIRRQSRDTLFSIELMTESGGRFHFGDPELKSQGFEPMATYDWIERESAHTGWVTIVIPFYNMVWLAQSNGSLPSHRPEMIRILAQRGWVEIDRIEYTRARTTKVSENDMVRVGFYCSDRDAKDFVLVDAHDSGSIRAKSRADSPKCHYFPPVPPGAYSIATAENPDQSKKLVEAWSDRFDVIVPA